MSGDPMLDGITRYSVRNDYLTSRAAVGDEPFKGSTDVVLFSDLPALLAAAREDERRTLPPTERHREWWIAFGMGKVQGQRDEREACIAAVEGLRAVTPNLIRRDDALAAIRARSDGGES